MNAADKDELHDVLGRLLRAWIDSLDEPLRARTFRVRVLNMPGVHLVHAEVDGLVRVDKTFTTRAEPSSE